LKVVIPPNTEAEIRLQTHALEAVTERGMPLNQTLGLSRCHFENNLVHFHVGAGQYEFIINSNAKDSA
jgi:hypothetical protein